MSEDSFSELESLLEKSDDELKQGLPDVLPAVDDDVETLLLEHPDAFEELVSRMGTLDDPAEFVGSNRETAESFLTVMWDGLNLITRTVPAVQEAVTRDVSVNWVCDDTALAWHMESDSDSGTITGGPGELEDAALRFSGDTDVMLSMVGDDDFDGQRAFMQGRFEMDGPIDMAMNLEGMMESVMTNAQEFEME